MAKTTQTSYVKVPTYEDVSGMYAIRAHADEFNQYNNNVHYHGFWEIECVISGSGTYEINNVVYPIKRGMLYITTPADYHTYSLGKGEDFEYFCVQFPTEHINGTVSSHLYSCSEPIAIELTGEDCADAYEMFGAIVSAYEKKEFLYDIIMRNLIEVICVKAIRNLEYNRSCTVSDIVIKNTVIFVKSHYREHITLHDAAKLAGMSDAYFSSVFSRAMGVGFSVYVRGVRLNSAANLLKSTNMTVKEICYSVGFGSVHYFTGEFKKHFGVPPRTFRIKNVRR